VKPSMRVVAVAPVGEVTTEPAWLPRPNTRRTAPRRP
jgi:hypothetical protein